MLKFSILYTERHIIIKTLNNIRRYLNLNRLSGRSLMSLELNQRMFSFMIFTVYITLSTLVGNKISFHMLYYFAEFFDDYKESLSRMVNFQINLRHLKVLT